MTEYAITFAVCFAIGLSSVRLYLRKIHKHLDSLEREMADLKHANELMPDRARRAGL